MTAAAIPFGRSSRSWAGRGRGWWPSCVARPPAAATPSQGTESLLAMVSRWVNNHQQPSDFYRDLLAPTLGRPRVELFNDEGVRLELADDTLPLPVEQPAPVGLAAAVALAGRIVRRVGQWMNQRRERAGRLPSPARRPWLPVRPLPGRGRR
jgi:hypothetical protein